MPSSITITLASLPQGDALRVAFEPSSGVSHTINIPLSNPNALASLVLILREARQCEAPTIGTKAAPTQAQLDTIMRSMSEQERKQATSAVALSTVLKMDSIFD